jgi:hypothetical protein
MTAFNISAVLYQEGDWWIGQCLEYDITAQANSLPDLQYELERVLFAHLCASMKEKRDPFHGLTSAPQKFWRMWEAGAGLERREFSFRPPTPMPFPSIVLKHKVGELFTALR